MFNKKVTYTPEIATVRKGKPVEGVVIAEGKGYYRLKLENGKEIKAPSEHCKAGV